MTQTQALFSEVFPILTAALPPLTAYRVHTPSREKLGGRLAFKLRQQFPGMWVWAGGLIITDTPPNPAKLLMVVDTLAGQSALFKGVVLEEVYGWQPDATTLADYVVRGPLEALEPAIAEALDKTAYTLKNARVERDFRVRTWVVNGEAALSFSVVSRLFYEADLQAYAATLPKTSELVGLSIMDKLSTMQGDVTKVVGKLAEHRERLLKLAQRPKMRDMIASAPDDNLVVRVLSGQHEYDYVANALRIVVRLDDARRFEVNPQHAARALRLKPALRAQMVKVVADIVKGAGLIGNAYSTQNAAERFFTAPPPIEVLFANRRARPYQAERLGQEAVANGFYWRRERFEAEPVRVAVINTLNEAVDDFLEAMRRTLERDFGYRMDVVRERKVRVMSQSNLESAVRVLKNEPFDVLLAFFADSDAEEDDEGANDNFIKSQTVGRGIPSLAIHASTLEKPEAMATVIMGMLARAGNVPYLLDVPLEYAEFVVGLDLIREKRRDGTTLTALTRIFRNDGALLCYLVGSAPVGEDEGIPRPLLESLLPADLLANGRVVIHHDGRLRRDELAALTAWEEAIDAVFYPVEILRRGVPRLYAFEKGKIERPPRGSGFRLSASDVFLVTAAAPYDATPQPLHIRAEPPFNIQDAVHSVVAFTQMHYGALQMPKLPVTIHHAESIRRAVERGVLPEAAQGDVQFWL